MEYAKTNINNLSNDQVLDKIEELQQLFRRYKQKTEQLQYYKENVQKGAEISDSVKDIVHKKPKTKVIKIEEPTEEKPIEAETEPNIATNRYYRPPSQKALRPSSMSETYYRPPTQKALNPSPIEEPICFSNIKYIKSLIKKHPELKDKIISSLMDEVVKGNLLKSDVENISSEFPVSTPQPFTYKTYQYAQPKTPLTASHETNIYKQIPSANRIFIKN